MRVSVFFSFFDQCVALLRTYIARKILVHLFGMHAFCCRHGWKIGSNRSSHFLHLFSIFHGESDNQ